MSIKTPFCPKCGKEATEIISGLCLECFLETVPIRIPSEVKIKYCVKCHAIYRNGFWKKSLQKLDSLFEAEIKDKIVLPIELTFKDLKIDDLENGIFTIIVSKDNDLFELEEKTNFMLDKVACPECSRRNKKYVAKIQVRFGRNIKRSKVEIEKFMKEYAPKLIKVEEFEYGYDFHFANDSHAVNVARRIAKRFRGKMRETVELFSWDKMKNRPKKRRIIMIRA